ncbi:hypothetical protein CC86DRAFT_91292 [Ophiobolus disseminans]|uniref:Uncharacterized protein n=1 Tax=Ophiobolus disseminans TaxID=1469910 RepID=A0A6A7AIN6_9PLEO|nr:hypothetical protein CC86DRAFT_91292 [Ophiobolus disseminans]
MSKSEQQNERASMHDDAPPAYTPIETPHYTHAHGCEPAHGVENSQTKTSPKRRLDADFPWVKELSQPSSPCIYEPHHDHTSSATSSSSPSTLKSKWRQLKRDNEERKAKHRNITHEQAAHMSGHDDLGFKISGESKGGMTREQWDNLKEKREKAGVYDSYGVMS